MICEPQIIVLNYKEILKKINPAFGGVLYAIG